MCQKIFLKVSKSSWMNYLMINFNQGRKFHKHMFFIMKIILARHLLSELVKPAAPFARAHFEKPDSCPCKGIGVGIYVKD